MNSFQNPAKNLQSVQSSSNIAHLHLHLLQLFTINSHLADTLIILNVAKSQAKIKMQRRLSTMNLRRTVKVKKKKNKTYQQQ